MPTRAKRLIVSVLIACIIASVRYAIRISLRPQHIFHEIYATNSEMQTVPVTLDLTVHRTLFRGTTVHGTVIF